jgi:DNA-binding transcriptional LysR family regulator
MSKALADIAAHQLIDKLHGTDLLCWRDVLGQSARGSNSQPVLGCDYFEAMRQAAVEGLGIAYLPYWVAGADIQAGLLTLVCPEWSEQSAASTGTTRCVRCETHLRESAFLGFITGVYRTTINLVNPIVGKPESGYHSANWTFCRVISDEYLLRELA